MQRRFWIRAYALALAALCALPDRGAPAQSPAPSPADEFAAAGRSTSFAFEWREGVVFLPVSLNGSRPLRFALDSGSTRTLIERTLADSLGLKGGDAGSLQGAGAGRIGIQAVGPVDLALPGLRTRGYDAYATDLKPVGQALKGEVDGILGYDFFARFVVTIDFAARRITLVDPSAWQPAHQAEAIALDIRDKWPFVEGELVLPGPVTVQDRFMIDSGSSDAVDHPVVKAMQSRTATQSGVGLGTPVDGATAQATAFRIGRFSVAQPTVACCGATEATSRLIGTEILRHFTVTFDYPASRLFLAPD